MLSWHRLLLIGHKKVHYYHIMLVETYSSVSLYCKFQTSYVANCGLNHESIYFFVKRYLIVLFQGCLLQ